MDSSGLRIPGPLLLEGNVAENWKRFRQRFELYMDASGSSAKTDRVKTSILLNAIGDDALEVYSFSLEVTVII